MFLTAVILILFFSLSDLAKWMNQNGLQINRNSLSLAVYLFL